VSFRTILFGLDLRTRPLGLVDGDRGL